MIDYTYDLSINKIRMSSFRELGERKFNKLLWEQDDIIYSDFKGLDISDPEQLMDIIANFKGHVNGGPLIRHISSIEMLYDKPKNKVIAFLWKITREPDSRIKEKHHLVEMIEVDPDYQRKGYATDMLDICHAWNKIDGILIPNEIRDDIAAKAFWGKYLDKCVQIHNKKDKLELLTDLGYNENDEIYKNWKLVFSDWDAGISEEEDTREEEC